MGQDFGNSGAPDGGVATAAARDAALGDVPGIQAASATLGKETIVVEAEDGLVAFVAAEEYANNKWLIEAGKVIKAPVQAGGTIGIVPAVTREGDVWARFVNGILVTDDPKVIAWCNARPTICRPETDPSTKAWATLKSMQTRRANRERILDPSEMNADETFPVGQTKLSEHVVSDDSQGGQAVESARVTRESVASAAPAEVAVGVSN